MGEKVGENEPNFGEDCVSKKGKVTRWVEKWGTG